MEKEFKNIGQRVKSVAKAVALTYCILGSCYGVGEYLGGNTTGHVSSDIHLGKYQPTRLEKAVVNFVLNEDLIKK